MQKCTAEDDLVRQLGFAFIYRMIPKPESCHYATTEQPDSSQCPEACTSPQVIADADTSRMYECDSVEWTGLGQFIKQHPLGRHQGLEQVLRAVNSRQRYCDTHDCPDRREHP